jgi:Domain of unknown function (DUF4157)
MTRQGLGYAMPAVTGPLPGQQVLQRKCACGTHTVGGKCAACSNKQSSLQRTTTNDRNDPAAVPPIVHDVLHSPGQPLDSATRAFFEPRLGHDFSQVRFKADAIRPMHSDLANDRLEQEADQTADRVSELPRGAESGHLGSDFGGVRIHTNGKAAESARAVGAKAYAVGQDIVFGAGHYAPHTETGRWLLAHELTHVVQQRALAAPVLARKGVDHYETKAIPLTGSVIETAGAGSYWEQKVSAVFKITRISPVKARFEADAEERDAVLSILWNVRPLPLTAETVRLVNIPPRAGTATSKELVYQFTFTPKKNGETSDHVAIAVQAEGGAAKTVAPPQPAAGYSPSGLSPSFSGFPGNNDIEAYWKKHPDEKKQVFNWIENVAPDPFEQIITTEVKPPAGSKSPVQKASFHVKGKKTGGTVQDLLIEFSGAVSTTKAEPPAGYHDKDRLDLTIEQLQTELHAEKKDKLGQLNGLNGLPADEKLPVKYAVWQYYGTGTRNAEVDVIVPIGTTGRRVFYTLRFGDNNNVEIERIAEEGKDAGQKSLDEMDVARVRGYADNSADPPALTSWLKTRYRSVAPTGKTVEELRQSVNSTMRSDAGKTAWFRDNYTLEVLDAAAGKKRLEDVHGVPTTLTADVKGFTAPDLNVVEFALQTMSDAMLGLIKGVQLVRKTMGFFRDDPSKPYRTDEKSAGLAQQSGSDSTITLFDRANLGDPYLFTGGKDGVRQEATMTAAHEFGHIVESQAGIKDAFSKFVAKNKIKPMTWYAAAQPTTDFFTEAFALYDTDRAWMKSNQPLLYDWFDKLSSTGKPPPP